MPQIDFSQVLKSYTGQNLADGETPVTLALIACNAITTPIAGEALTGPQKIQRVELARRIHQATGAISLPAEDVALLKSAINAVYASPVLVAASWTALDPQ